MSHEHAKRGRIPIACLDVEVVASAEIHRGVTRNHVGSIGVARTPATTPEPKQPKQRKQRSDAGRAKRIGGISEMVCVSMNTADLADLVAIQNHHNITRSEAIRVAVRLYLAQLKGL